MKKLLILFALVFVFAVAFGQDIHVTFTGLGVSTHIDSIRATNLTKNQRITLPGNQPLVLSGNTGIGTAAKLTKPGLVYPNPCSGKATLNVSFETAQTVFVQIENFVGQVLAHSKVLAQPGENEFGLSIAGVGIYTVRVESESQLACYKIISTAASEPDNSITYSGSVFNNPISPDTRTNLELKSSLTGYFLGYSTGDIIQYFCYSGIYKTVLTDSPTASKNYDVVFSSCVDTDGKSYSTVKIGTQTWMAENLAYLPSVSESTIGSSSEKHYYVYGYEGISVNSAKGNANYTTYGVLYNWEAAKTACPTGWHLPADGEWTTLTDYLTNNGYGFGGSGSDIGKSMASTSGWTSNSVAGTIGNDPGSNNRSGFSAVPGGDRSPNGGVFNLGNSGSFWSSTADGTTHAWYRGLNNTVDIMIRINYGRMRGFSVRCLQNN